MLMERITNFFKGFIVGIGGIAPGLSGSALLVIFGLYEKTIHAIGTLFKDFKKNITFLIPIFLGFGIGMIIFSKVVNFFLMHFEIYTRFTFLGLVIGTVPLFYRETKKNGWHQKYYIPVGISFGIGLLLFFFNRQLFPQITNLNFIQSLILGMVVAGSTIVPGIDSATILSALGLYEIYLLSIDSLNFSILIPAGFGLLIGSLAISFFMNRLLKTKYTLVFSVILGLFLSIIPSVIGDNWNIGFTFDAIMYIVLACIGCIVSYQLGKINNTD